MSFLDPLVDGRNTKNGPRERSGARQCCNREGAPASAAHGVTWVWLTSSPARVPKLLAPMQQSYPSHLSPAFPHGQGSSALLSLITRLSSFPSQIAWSSAVPTARHHLTGKGGGQDIHLSWYPPLGGFSTGKVAGKVLFFFFLFSQVCCETPRWLLVFESDECFTKCLEDLPCRFSPYYVTLLILWILALPHDN